MRFLFAFLSALMFSVAAPSSKGLLSWFGPSFIAGFSYIYSAAALFIISLFLKNKEEKIKLKDDGWRLFFIVISGGTLAPFFLLNGLALSHASNASLLLNLETVFTSMIAVFFLKEKGGSRFWLSAILIFVSASLVSFEPDKVFSFNLGSIFVIMAALMWAIDNNITATISIKNPVSIAIIKGAAGGCINLLISVFSDEKNIFSFFPMTYLFLMGAVSYGGSLVLMIYSQRKIGAARTSLIFGSYPIISFILSVIFLRETLVIASAAAFLLACLAFWLACSEKHSHPHVHMGISHSHKHDHHDIHHSHSHSKENAVHSHEHSHTFLLHSHEHEDDAHHKHH
ncbi:MAG: DMT family transporter [Elusimicrobiota bacterium]